MRFFITCALLSYSSLILSQTIEGKWKGKMYFPGTTDSTTIELEMHFKKNKKLAGTTTCYFNNDNSAVTDINITYDSLKNTLYIKEIRVIQKRMLPDLTSFFLDEYYLNFETEKKLSGIVKCYKYVQERVNVIPDCHPDMYIDLIKQ